jgi:predicted RNA-binding protein with PIN domain
LGATTGTRKFDLPRAGAETGRTEPLVSYLIDGNNLLHAAASHGPRRSIARDVLCRLVAQWGRDREVDDLTVVFDGPVPPGDLARQIRQPGVTVLFSSPRTADEVIEEVIAGARAPGRITVVTTDRAIQHAVRYRRGRCIDSELFLAQLWQQAESSSAPVPKPPEKPQDLSTTETRGWLADFGPDLPDAVDDAEMME